MIKLKKLIAKYFSSFVYFYRHLRYRVFIAVVLSILVGVLDGFGLSMFLPLLQMVNDTSTVDPEALGNLRFIVDTLEDLGFSLTLATVLSFLFIFFLFKGIAKFCSDAYRVIVQQYFIRKIRLNMVSSLNHLAYKRFVTTDVGRIQNTLSGEVDRVARSYKAYFAALEQGILVAVYMSFAFFVDPQFAVLVSVGGFLTNFLYNKIYKHTKGTSIRLTADTHVFQSQIIQHVANFKYLKATGSLNKFADKLKSSIYKMEHSNRKIGMLATLLTATREPLLIGVVAVVIMIQTGVLNSGLGPILISLLFFYRALSSLMQMQNVYNQYLGMSGSLENMAEFQAEIDRYKEPVGSTPIDTFKEEIALQSVDFRYDNQKVLSTVDLSIHKNETVAFVGESGSGKTTLVNLLAGLMPVDSGKITIDNINREDLDINTFQNRIGYITQDPVIFNDTIINNVTLWDEKNAQTEEHFWESVRKASVHDFIISLPKKERTLLGNNGVNLSGGQKQRISIARELYKDVDILIMDEATSALDSETERAIQQNIDALKGSYTILIVAHRLSTIKNADKIVLMRNGKIVQVGTYQELMKGAEDFKRMVELQEL